MNQTIRNFLLLSGFYLLQAIVFFILFNNANWLNSTSLLNWDAEHYHNIVVEGYNQTRTAFFPLFPLLWKYTGFGNLAISILNALIFIGSFAWLSTLFQLNKQQLFLIAAIPSFIFFFLPYSESVFFAGATLLLTGYKKNNYKLVLIGLVLSSFARPAASVFLPAIILIEWFTRESASSAIKNISLCILALLVGMTAAFAVHYSFTDEWFGFFNVQKNVWDNRLQIPSLPLRSWAGLKITILDGTALFVGFISTWQIIKWLLPNIKEMRIVQDKSLLFSLLYLLGIALLVLMYRDGSLFSLNRFSFSTAFFIVAASYFTSKTLNNKSLFWLIGLLFWWFLFASYVHITTLLKYIAATGFIGLTILAIHQNKVISKLATSSLFIGLCVLQLYFMYRFLTNEWVG